MVTKIKESLIPFFVYFFKINTIYEESSIRLQFMESKITGFR